MRFLIDAGADLDATEDNGCTALMLAALRDYPEIVRQLANAGALRESPGPIEAEHPEAVRQSILRKISDILDAEG